MERQSPPIPKTFAQCNHNFYFHVLYFIFYNDVHYHNVLEDQNEICLIKIAIWEHRSPALSAGLLCRWTISLYVYDDDDDDE